MKGNYFNTTMRNIEYRLRAFKDELPYFLSDIIKDKEDVIVSAVADDQMYRRGINGRGVKIASYAPYAERTKEEKRRKGQPTTRVTLRDEGNFHLYLGVMYTPEGFYIDSGDVKTKWLLPKYGEDVLRLTDENLTRILKSHIRKELVKRLKREIKAGRK